MITIKLIDSGCEKYLIDADCYCLGRQWDSLAEQIQIIKPEKEKGNVCTMIVSAEGVVIDHMDIKDIPKDITNVLSEHSIVEISFSFTNEEGYVKNSEVKEFYFARGRKPESFIPTTPEQTGKIDIMLGNGFVKADLNGNIVRFYNANGDKVQDLDLSSISHDVEVPTKLSELENDTEFIDKTVDNLINYYKKSETYTQQEIDNKLSSVPKFAISVVTSLPTSSISSTTIYLLKVNSSTGNLYEEYIYVNNAWELLGTARIDLTNYIQKTDIEDSDSVIHSFTGNKLQFNLSAILQNKISKSLVTPMSRPTATELVGVDSTNSQTMIKIGDGLVLENGVLSSTATGGEVDTEILDQIALDAQKQILLGADGVLEGNVYNFTIDNPETYIGYRTNLTKFLVDLNLPISGDVDTTKEVTITFGDTSYYVFNILKGMEHATIGDLHQVDKYNNETGYRFISEMTFFETSDIVGFAIIPTISMSDILSLDSDQMDNYMADGGLTQGQLAVCNKVITNGYEEGALYRFDIVYPSTYSWTYLAYSKTGMDEVVREKLDKQSPNGSVIASFNENINGNAQLDYFNIRSVYNGETIHGLNFGNDGFHLDLYPLKEIEGVGSFGGKLSIDAKGFDAQSSVSRNDGKYNAGLISMLRNGVSISNIIADANGETEIENKITLNEDGFQYNGKTLATVDDIQSAIQSTWEASY